MFVVGTEDSRFRQISAASVAIFVIPILSIPNTTSRCNVDVEL